MTDEHPNVSLETRVRAAFGARDAAAVPRLFDRHPEFRARMADAAWHGDARAASVMLELGFDPRTTGHDSGIPLHLAAWEGSTHTVAALLRHPDASALVSRRDAHYGAKPLGWCCHGSLHGNATHDRAGVARLLLEAGAQPGTDTQEASAAVRAVLSQ
jgi:hypothetical protein